MVAVLVPFLIMGFYLLDKNEEILREKVGETLANSLLRRTTQVDTWMADRLQELSRWSTSFVAFEGVAALASRGQGADRARRDLTEFLLSLQRYNRVYESLFIVGLDGSLLAATGDESPDDWARTAIARGGIKEGVLSPVFFSSRLGRATLLGLHPIRDAASQTLGYLGGRIDLKDLESRLGPPASEPSLTFWLLDKDGRFVARAGKIVALPGKELFPIALSSAAKAGQVSTISSAEMPGLPGPTLYSIRPFEGPSPGYLVATLPSSVAYRALHESRRRLALFGLPFFLAGLVSTTLMARHFLQPILRLSEGALRVSAGDFDVQLPEGGNDELADLTRIFNLMARRVREGRKGLEEARDELARSNRELTRVNETLEHLAITDGLTGLYNHRHFHDMLQREVQLGGRSSQHLTLLMLDLDHFKTFNDQWGHSAGDAVLRAVAGSVKLALRTTDLAFRYGGEELAVLLPGCDKPKGAEIAEKLRTSVRQIPSSEDRPGSLITVSIGVATFPDDAREPHDLLDKADAALYAAKWRGRDCVVVSGGIRVTEGTPARDG